VDELLDEIFSLLGYFEEKNGALTFEGAKGAARIARLVDSYVKQPPREMLDLKVVSVRDFERETVRDVEGDEIPKEKMSIFELEDRTRIAVRASGTEPKIKYYLFAERRPEAGPFDAAQLREIKAEVHAHLEALWDWVREDAEARS
jgi:phosphoglucomutase